MKSQGIGKVREKYENLTWDKGKYRVFVRSKDATVLLMYFDSWV